MFDDVSALIAQLLGICLDCLLEACHRRADRAGTDLAEACDLMCNAGVDNRGNALFDNQTCVDTEADALEIPCRYGEVRVAVDTDLHHFIAGAQCALLAASTAPAGNRRS